MTTALSWYGGKSLIAKHILEVLSRIPHDTFVDVFGGSGAIIFGKAPVKIDVYNDLHKGLVNFMQVLRNQPDELQRLLTLTVYSREEFTRCFDWPSVTDPVEQARQFFVTTQQSYGAKGHTSRGQWAYSRTASNRGMSKHVSGWLTKIDTKLPLMVNRARALQVEQLDFGVIFDKYDSPTTLFYCDPPYLPATRTSPKQYAHEMTYQGHERLVDRLLKIEGAVVLSGYENSLYDSLGWVKIKLGLQPLHTVLGGTKKKKMEILWVKH